MKIVFTLSSGKTAIMTPALQADVAEIIPGVAELTEQQYVEFIRDRDVPKDATNIRIVEDHEIPEDRTFRNALRHDLTHDIDQCVEITKDRLRREREPLLKAQDIEFLRAQEQGIPTGGISSEKQRLRDITLLPNNTMTLDELKALKAAKD